MSRHAKSLANALEVLSCSEYKQYIEEIYLYGSCARGEQKYSSDVDLFIKVKEDTPQKVLLDMRRQVMPEDEKLPEVELKFSSTDNFSSSSQFNTNIKTEGKLLWRRM
ncbi:MAG: nucleotidyltransferase domain-containing protein [Lachnospiraceae bacterium]|nr:nucleotidyltransferase domain-containing protein [Lachnospiraceae bacterium]